MSLTGCIKKAGAALRPEDKKAILDRAREFRADGKSAADAGRAAIQAQLEGVREAMRKASSSAQVLNQSAFHGTPHRFDKFSTDAMGTGEGAQAYGWGLYFASKRDIAEHYRQVLSGDGYGVVKIDGQPQLSDPEFGDLMVLEVDERPATTLSGAEGFAFMREQLAPWLDNAYQADKVKLALSWLDKAERAGQSIEVPGRDKKGQLYEVQIPEDSEMLLWDKPLSEQPTAAQKSVRALLADIPSDWLERELDRLNVDPEELTGQDIYKLTQRALREDALIPNVGSAADQAVIDGNDDKAASLILMDDGIKGIKYLDGSSRSAGDGSYNYVVFSGDDVAIQQTFYQGGQQPRGTFSPANLELALSPNADLSTFFHETGHFFLEVMADLAAQPSAPQGIADDMAVLLKWFGVSDLATWQGMTLEQQRPLHERFAESIEQYIVEGKAPSAELAPAFRKFRAWVLNVYKSLKQMAAGATPGPELSPEVRQVFDRMLASQEQIAQTEAMDGLMPDDSATAEAEERLTARSVRDLKWSIGAVGKEVKKLQKQAADLRATTEAQVAEEVDQMPEFRAKAALDALQVNPDHAAGVTHWNERRAEAAAAAREIAKQELLATNPEAQGLKKGQLLAKNKRTLDNKAETVALAWEQDNPRPSRPNNITEEDFATVADSFGFPDADTMLKAIDAIGSKASVIETLTDRRMLEEHGDLVDADAIREAAQQAVHNEARARSLATELKAQTDMLGGRIDTGQVNAKGSKITVGVIEQAAKLFAAKVVASTPLRDLKAKARQHTAAEARAGRRWQDATAAGDTKAAVKAKQDQVLNHAAAKAALEALEEAEKIQEFFATVTKGSNEKTVKGGRDPDVVNAARAMLAAYGVGPTRAKSALEYLGLVEKNDPAMFASLQPSLQGALNMAQPLEALTFEQLQGLHEEVQAMWHLAKRSRQMEVDGNLLDIEDAEAELHDRLEEVGIPAESPGESGAMTPAETRVRWLQFAGSLLRRVEQWAEGLDGKYGGPFLRLVFQPVKAKADAYRADKVVYRKAYLALLDNVAPAMRKGLIDAPELGYTFGKGHNGIGHAELLHAVLHTGNESNKRKLLLGGRPNNPWAFENADGTLNTGPMANGRAGWDAFIKRMHETGVIAQVHYDFVQSVWDLLEKTKPLAQRAHRDMFGRYFDEVTANAFNTPFGSYRGGYVPAQADPRLGQDKAMRKLLEVTNEKMTDSFPTVGRGFTKSRVEFNRPLMLDLRTLGQHLDKVLLFSHMAPAVQDATRLLARPGVSTPLGKIDPSIYPSMLTPWLKRTGRQIVETPTVDDGGISRVLSAARSRAGMSLMFANISNTIQQVTGFAGAFAKLKSDGLQSSMMRATAQFVSAPRKMAKAVGDASPYMASRMENEVAAINDAMNEILLDQSLYERAQAWSAKHAYFLQSALDNTMGPIIWTSAYNGALGKGMTQEDAVRYADGLIRQTQGSTLPEDVSRIETGSAYARMFTQFIGYFNMMANTNATAVKQIASDVGLKRGAGKALGLLTLGMLVPLWIAEAIAVAMKGGPDDPDGDGYLDDWIAAVLGMGTIKGALAMVPFVGQLANAGINRWNHNPADDRVSLSPAVSILEGAVGSPKSVYDAIVNDGNKQKAVRDVASAVSILTGLPATAIARPVGYLAAVNDGRVSPTSTADAIRGTLTGVASPESKNK